MTMIVDLVMVEKINNNNNETTTPNALFAWP